MRKANVYEGVIEGGIYALVVVDWIERGESFLKERTTVFGFGRSVGMLIN